MAGTVQDHIPRQRIAGAWNEFHQSVPTVLAGSFKPLAGRPRTPPEITSTASDYLLVRENEPLPGRR